MREEGEVDRLEIGSCGVVLVGAIAERTDPLDAGEGESVLEGEIAGAIAGDHMGSKIEEVEEVFALALNGEMAFYFFLRFELSLEGSEREVDRKGEIVGEEGLLIRVEFA